MGFKTQKLVSFGGGPNRREREEEEKREEEEEEEKKKRREEEGGVQEGFKGMELHGILKFCMNFHALMVIMSFKPRVC